MVLAENNIILILLFFVNDYEIGKFMALRVASVRLGKRNLKYFANYVEKSASALSRHGLEAELLEDQTYM